MILDKLRTHYGSLVVFALAVVPIVLWLAAADRAELFGSGVAAIAAAGKVAALSGMALYSLMPILSMRHRIIEQAFGGLDKVYKLHATSGKVSFYVILAHPLLLAASAVLGGAGIAEVWNWASAVVILGILGLIGLIVITAFTIYAHVKHQKWIAVHRLFGWLLPVFFAHALLARSQIIANRSLFVYMVGLGSLGLGAFLYRSVFGRFVIKKYRYVIAEVNRVTPTVTELVLKPKGIPISYTPGQFAYLSVRNDAVDAEAHPYSFTTANNGPYVRFAVKALGDDSAKLQDINPGADAYLEGPYGNFSYHNSKNKNQVWIAGGVGITPFLSMARSLSAQNKYNIHLFYAAEAMSDAVFLRELLAIRNYLFDSFETTIVNRQLSGFVSVDMIEQQIPDMTIQDYLICGPPTMMKVLKKQLLAKGVPDHAIHTEEFSML